jgi:hypothetical protein
MAEEAVLDGTSDMVCLQSRGALPYALARCCVRQANRKVAKRIMNQRSKKAETKAVKRP